MLLEDICCALVRPSSRSHRSPFFSALTVDDIFPKLHSLFVGNIDNVHLANKTDNYTLSLCSKPRNFPPK